MRATQTSTEQLDAVILGAGVAGLYQLDQLREQGLRMRAIDKAGDVGGTWWWNRYPAPASTATPTSPEVGGSGGYALDEGYPSGYARTRYRSLTPPTPRQSHTGCRRRRPRGRCVLGPSPPGVRPGIRSRPDPCAAAANPGTDYPSALQHGGYPWTGTIDLDVKDSHPVPATDRDRRLHQPAAARGRR